jgi:hypothetical protein
MRMNAAAVKTRRRSASPDGNRAERTLTRRFNGSRAKVLNDSLTTAG